MIKLTFRIRGYVNDLSASPSEGLSVKMSAEKVRNQIFDSLYDGEMLWRMDLATREKLGVKSIIPRPIQEDSRGLYSLIDIYSNKQSIDDKDIEKFKEFLSLQTTHTPTSTWAGQGFPLLDKDNKYKKYYLDGNIVDYVGYEFLTDEAFKASYMMRDLNNTKNFLDNMKIKSDDFSKLIDDLKSAYGEDELEYLEAK